MTNDEGRDGHCCEGHHSSFVIRHSSICQSPKSEAFVSTEVLVPLGQTVDTLTLVSWYKQEGEAVIAGEPLYAVETDKATLDVEAPATGVLRQVTASPGDVVKVLRAIA